MIFKDNDIFMASVLFLWPHCIAGCGHIYFRPVFGRPME